MWTVADDCGVLEVEVEVEVEGVPPAEGPPPRFEFTSEEVVNEDVVSDEEDEVTFEGVVVDVESDMYAAKGVAKRSFNHVGFARSHHGGNESLLLLFSVREESVCFVVGIVSVEGCGLKEVEEVTRP